MVALPAMPDARGNRGVRADPDVMRDLDLVVELDARPRSPYRPACRGRSSYWRRFRRRRRSATRPICGIFFHTPSSRAMPKPSAPITTPACTMQRAPMRAIVVHRYVRVQRAVVADRRAVADEASGADLRPFADAHPFADDRPGADAGGFVDARRFVDHRGLVHAGNRGCGGIEQRRDLGEIGIGIAAYDTRQRGRVAGVGAEYDRPCPGAARAEPDTAAGK